MYQKQYDSNLNKFISNRVYLNQLSNLTKTIYNPRIVPPTNIEVINQGEDDEAVMFARFAKESNVVDTFMGPSTIEDYDMLHTEQDEAYGKI